MTKKSKKDKKPRAPKVNQQIPISRIRPVQFAGLRQMLQKAREYPLLGCWVMAGWAEHGITPVVVARQQAPDRVLYGVYMIDLYCLGIKDAYARADVFQGKFERELPKLCSGAPEQCSVELAHEIIYGGLEFAARYDLQPHPDFTGQAVDQVLDGPEAHPRTHNVQFGKDGKPFYISGPYDDERKINAIANTLKRTAGEGNFEVLINLGSPDDFSE